MLTLARPQSLPAETNSSASRMSLVKMAEDKPCGTALFSAMASASSSYLTM
jgi:hypothetical protein